MPLKTIRQEKRYISRERETLLLFIAGKLANAQAAAASGAANIYTQ